MYIYIYLHLYIYTYIHSIYQFCFSVSVSIFCLQASFHFLSVWFCLILHLCSDAIGVR